MSSTIPGSMGSATVGGGSMGSATVSGGNDMRDLKNDARDLKNQAAASAERVGDSAGDELARLRAQVERLMSDRVTPALASAADSMQGYAEQARDAIEDQADALSETVRDRPLIAVGAALVGGYLLGRLMAGNTYVYPRGH